jgi:hypothetical protein
MNEMSPDVIYQAIKRNQNKRVKLDEVKDTNRGFTNSDLLNQSIDTFNRIFKGIYRILSGGGIADQNGNLVLDYKGQLHPPSLANADADNNSVYYSTTNGKLVYKNSSGTVNNLY